MTGASGGAVSHSDRLAWWPKDEEISPACVWRANGGCRALAPSTYFCACPRYKNRPNSNRWPLIFGKTEYLKNCHISKPNHPMMPRAWSAIKYPLDAQRLADLDTRKTPAGVESAWLSSSSALEFCGLVLTYQPRSVFRHDRLAIAQRILDSQLLSGWLSHGEAPQDRQWQNKLQHTEARNQIIDAPQAKPPYCLSGRRVCSEKHRWVFNEKLHVMIPRTNCNQAFGGLLVIPLEQPMLHSPKRVCWWLLCYMALHF
ncbi:hypothetical protein PGT21_033473 [Puccinia graminis f. sp. tritici]|uniref:Uncharacterized protein n=1 Tax=Puccinia graminis f. sp. tritici TaxID=56615 RepID=A0A5B0R2H5_PUCGR|nr:hypothetical protein PGT21_033473 [Puccinia graminis f. sp. tritici]